MAAGSTHPLFRKIPGDSPLLAYFHLLRMVTHPTTIVVISRRILSISVNDKALESMLFAKCTHFHTILTEFRRILPATLIYLSSNGNLFPNRLPFKSIPDFLLRITAWTEEQSRIRIQAATRKFKEKLMMNRWVTRVMGIHQESKRIWIQAWNWRRCEGRRV